MYNRDLLFELFNGILANGARATRIKATIAEIQKEKTISERKKEEELTQDNID